MLLLECPLGGWKNLELIAGLVQSKYFNKGGKKIETMFDKCCDKSGWSICTDTKVDKIQINEKEESAASSRHRSLLNLGGTSHWTIGTI